MWVLFVHAGVRGFGVWVIGFGVRSIQRVSRSRRLCGNAK